MSKKTPLYDRHVKSKALIVDFSGWQMPLHYGSQITEHHAVRKNIGVFDVSHMGVVDIRGKNTVPFLRHVLANDVAKLMGSGIRDQKSVVATGSALYSCMLNESGGVIDDLIVYHFSNDYFRLVINAGCRDKDFQWLQMHATQFDVQLVLRADLCILALQGPQFLSALKNIFDEDIVEKIAALKPFQFYTLPDTHADTMITRTGYTGESGVEIILPASEAIKVWEKLIATGVQPCGLGARDTLRLEAGYNLFGADMTETTSPLISNLAWTVSFKDESRDFIGKNALFLEKQKGISQQLIGLVLESRGVLRNHQKVKIDNIGEGEITSGSFSPTLNKSIALARVPVCNAADAFVEIRSTWLPVQIVKPKFI
ncbi:MAG: glycine cleavage system protein T [Gammaproteobacteria bacterium RIFCSPHIGHO2_12_FULL_38_11]|nr:MAG: glycine cleavage system protein T [Gammaproteobacteria bacterium RIFCSPHIGHO2_12_FULL_38_11]